MMTMVDQIKDTRKKYFKSFDKNTIVFKRDFKNKYYKLNKKIFI